MVSGEGLREAVARAICVARNLDPDDHVPGDQEPNWSLWTHEADAALRAIVEAAGLDAEGLTGVAENMAAIPEWLDAENAVYLLLRALASAAEREGGL